DPWAGAWPPSCWNAAPASSCKRPAERPPGPADDAVPGCPPSPSQGRLQPSIIGGMDRYERSNALHRILKAARYPVTVPRLQEELGCSRATVYRDLAFLRDALMAPVEGDGEAGFRYAAAESERFELPGLWLSSEELYALLASQQLLRRTGAGVLSSVLAPLQQRIEGLLAAQAGTSRWPVAPVRERVPLAFECRARCAGHTRRRKVSPQRITQYRDNWYLDAWDHEREALRSFAGDRIMQARLLEDPAQDVEDAVLDQHFASS